MTVTVRCLLRARAAPAVSVHEVQAILQTLLDAAGLPEWDVGCCVTTDRALAALNRQYRGGKKGPTDILSFAFHEVNLYHLSQMDEIHAFHGSSANLFRRKG